MPNVKRRVKRTIGRIRTDGRLAVPNFISFETGRRPRWWSDARIPESYGEVLGVYENEPGSESKAVVVTEEGVVLLDDPERWVRYSQIARWDSLSKAPPSKILVLWTESGARLALPFEGAEGDAFAFVQFLINAIHETKR